MTNGWSTWDYYFTSAMEDDVKANVDFIAATPVFSGEEGLPEIWKKEQTDSAYVFNFGEGQKTYLLKIENGTYYHVFEEETYSVENGELRLSVSPHDCVCLYKIKE